MFPFIAAAVLFGFGLVKTHDQYAKVVYVDEDGAVQQTKVLQPILVIKEEDSVLVRSGHKQEGKIHASFPRFGSSDMAIFDAMDAAAYEIKLDKGQ